MCVCVCACVCVCVCCLATQICTFRSTSSQGDQEVARVGTPTTDYKLVVRPWESGIRPCNSYHFPRSDNYCVCVCVSVCVCVHVLECMYACSLLLGNPNFYMHARVWGVYVVVAYACVL